MQRYVYICWQSKTEKSMEPDGPDDREFERMERSERAHDRLERLEEWEQEQGDAQRQMCDYYSHFFDRI